MRGPPGCSLFHAVTGETAKPRTAGPGLGCPFRAHTSAVHGGPVDLLATRRNLLQHA
ncbi:hypothetical protein SFR_0066 [Streptomyces sp. FR-008]|nr:hypothetical protein SFR_0066 [Streptomyces sp. FR-008]